MRRWLYAVLVAVLTLVASGCVSSSQRALADELYTDLLLSSGTLLNHEGAIPAAIKARDTVTIHKGLIAADDARREWRRKSESATGKVAEAAKLYADALAAWSSMFESAERTAKTMDSLESRQMVRHQEDAHELMDKALAQLEKLK